MSSNSEESFVDDELIIQDPLTQDKASFKALLLQDLPVPVCRRHSFSGYASSESSLFEESEYFTPDCSCQRNADFLGKLRDIFNEPASASADTTLTKNHRRSSLPQTLINEMETLSYTSEDKNAPSIEISENDIDDDFLRYQGTQIKYEDITDVDIECVDDDDDNDEHEDSLSKTESPQAYTDHFNSVGSDSSHAKSFCDERFGNISSSSYASSTGAVANTDKENYDRNSTTAPQVFKTPLKRTAKAESFLRPPQFSCKDILQPINYDADCRLKSPKSMDKYKHIQSPVGFYIKNSAASGIRRLAKPTRLPTPLPDSWFDGVPDVAHKLAFEISDAIYKPATLQHMQKIVEVRLPKNIQMLVPNVPDMLVYQTERRINGREESQANIRRKLDQNFDLTRIIGDLDISSPDISIINVKPCF